MSNQETADTSARIQWSGWTDRGKVRQNNEDAFLGVQFDAREVHILGRFGEGSIQQTDFAFAVSDGIGGARAGEYASRIAIDKITTLLPRSFKQSAAGLDAGFGDVMEELFDRIHRALTFVGGSYEECSGMETTLSLCWFVPGWMYFGHIGDSRIYTLPKQANTIKQLSHDDTHVGWLFRSGKLNEREVRNHPGRKVLQKSLGGSNQFVTPQVGAVSCEAGDTFLLCTDGLVEGLYNSHLTEILRTGPQDDLGITRARRLVDAAVERDGTDNSTALVIEVA